MEHSNRSREVTEQVALWIANDGNYIYRARQALTTRGVAALADYLTGAILGAAHGSAPWHVRQELAPNDWSRIRWDDVADEIREEG